MNKTLYLRDPEGDGTTMTASAMIDGLLQTPDDVEPVFIIRALHPGSKAMLKAALEAARDTDWGHQALIQMAELADRMHTFQQQYERLPYPEKFEEGYAFKPKENVNGQAQEQQPGAAPEPGGAVPGTAGAALIEHFDELLASLHGAADRIESSLQRGIASLQPGDGAGAEAVRPMAGQPHDAARAVRKGPGAKRAGARGRG